MKTRKINLALGLAMAVLAGPVVTAGVAQAGDYMDGGLKGMRGSYVPVPAPVPIPEYTPKYYLRADVGVGMNLGMKTKENGMRWGSDDLGHTNASVIDPVFGFGALSNFGTDGNDDVGHSLGIGAGYYFSPSFRMDLTGEIRMMKSSTMSGQFEYTDANNLNTQVYGDVSDRTTMRSGIFLANAYYDVTGFGRFKPYIGGGLGFSVNEIERNHRTDISSCTSGGATPCNPGNATYEGSITANSGIDYTYSLAAAATAGVSYKISDITSLDFNYRYLYVGGTDKSMAINGSNSTVNIADQHEHYLRAGLRWDIN